MVVSTRSILSEIAQGIENAISNAGRAKNVGTGVSSRTEQDVENVANTLECTVKGEKGCPHYPALGIADALYKEDKRPTDIFQLFRHGVIIESAEGNYYYVGGASPYWDGKDFLAVQGGACFLVKGENVVKSMRKANIVVVRLKRGHLGRGIEEHWQQPNPPEGCSTPVIGWFETAAENSRDAGGVMPNYLPYYTDYPFHALKVPGILVDVSDDKLSATILKENLKGISDQPPVPFIVARTVGTPFQQKNPNAVINGMMAVAVLDSQLQEKLCNLFITQDKRICGTLSTVKGFSDALIGAPVFTAYSCLSGCKEPGIVGVVASATQLAGPVVSLVLVPLPTAYTDQAFEQLASALGVQDVFNESVRALEKVNGVILSLHDKYNVSYTFASAVMDYVEWDSEEQMMTDAKPYVENYHKLVETLRAHVEREGDPSRADRIERCAEITFYEDYDCWEYDALECVDSTNDSWWR
ncbi:hypothetical protein [Sulfuracidifex tepidarius]|uniref:hypothetical protein n=1 Tax=Sulfuracidifex tepidarius TaxID=1294262 RepID=UPI0011F266B5|nr:hypothetical protein [Sulfuracidifex tepidarius]